MNLWWSVESHLDYVETGWYLDIRDKHDRDLITGHVAYGIKEAWTYFRLLCGTWELVVLMVTEKLKQRTCKSESTDATHKGGEIRSSDEASVMEVEWRDFVIQLY